MKIKNKMGSSPSVSIIDKKNKNDIDNQINLQMREKIGIFSRKMQKVMFFDQLDSGSNVWINEGWTNSGGNWSDAGWTNSGGNWSDAGWNNSI